MWNKNEREGKVDQAKGKVKQAVAAVTRDEHLKAEGKADEAAGKVKSAIGEITHKAGDAIAEVAKAVKQ